MKEVRGSVSGDIVFKKVYSKIRSLL